MKFTTRFSCWLLLLNLVVALSITTVWAQEPSQAFFDLHGTAGPLPSGTYPAGPYTWPADSNCLNGSNCDYWNMLNGTGNNSSTGAVGANSAGGQSSVRVFVNGTATTESFTGGGSKDPLDLSQWAYSTSPTPNKDTLNAGYAAAYQLGGDFDVVFGSDRLSPNGDANIGGRDDSYASRLAAAKRASSTLGLIPDDNFQVLCSSCHQLRTATRIGQ